MMTAIQNLENDHIYILRLTDVMEKIAQKDTPDIAELETIVYLIKNYADGFHHAKEENLLFPLMAEKGFSTEQGPVAVMLYEHEQGRNFVKGITNGIAQYKENIDGSLAIIVSNIRGYIALLRNHIYKENNILFRMADKALSHEEQELLIKEFGKVESSNVCGGVLKDCAASIDALSKKYL